MRTSDAHTGARQISRMPTLQCENCQTYYWDSEVHEKLSGVSRSETKASDIDAMLTGSVCPDCGHEQNNS